MTDASKIRSAIEHIKSVWGVLEWAAEIAEDSMEKQIPCEVGADELGISTRNPIITPCGNCGEELTDRMYSFCPWCGQRIKWRRK